MLAPALNELTRSGHDLKGSFMHHLANTYWMPTAYS